MSENLSDQVIKIQGDESLSDEALLKKEDDQGQLSLDIFETEDKIIIIAPIAGIDEKSLEISVNEDLLTIKGARPRPSGLPKHKTYLIEECYWGVFSRNVLMPAAVNSAEIIARMQRDILIVEIPKARKVKTKIISIFSSN